MLHGSVGLQGINNRPDVIAVQKALNAVATRLGILPLREDGQCGNKTIDAIRRFQSMAVKMPAPDGLISPNGPTARLLRLAGPGAPSVISPPGAANMSGSAWWRANQARWKNEDSVTALSQPFQGNVNRFIAALRAAGATVTISATTRSMTRAKLMRYSWDVSKSIIAPNAVPKIDQVDINWDHGDAQTSRRAALEMVNLFQIVKQPSLTSNHLAGNAIDMTIGWNGDLSIKKADGKVQVISGAPRNGTNAKLHDVGATYNVLHKLPDDPPHWSTTGR